MRRAPAAARARSASAKRSATVPRTGIADFAAEFPRRRAHDACYVARIKIADFAAEFCADERMDATSAIPIAAPLARRRVNASATWEESILAPYAQGVGTNTTSTQ